MVSLPHCSLMTFRPLDGLWWCRKSCLVFMTKVLEISIKDCQHFSGDMWVYWVSFVVVDLPWDACGIWIYSSETHLCNGCWCSCVGDMICASAQWGGLLGGELLGLRGWCVVSALVTENGWQFDAPVCTLMEALWIVAFIELR